MTSTYVNYFQFCISPPMETSFFYISWLRIVVARMNQFLVLWLCNTSIPWHFEVFQNLCLRMESADLANSEDTMNFSLCIAILHQICTWNWFVWKPCKASVSGFYVFKEALVSVKQSFTVTWNLGVYIWKLAPSQCKLFQKCKFQHTNTILSFARTFVLYNINNAQVQLAQ